MSKKSSSAVKYLIYEKELFQSKFGYQKRVNVSSGVTK